MSKAPLAFTGLGVALLGWTAFATWTEPSPGELAAPHADLVTRHGTQECRTCHGAAGLTAGCLDCHAEIRSQHDSQEGYHAAILDQGMARCETCHGDHYGSGFALVNDGSWKRASPEGFRHEFTDFSLHSAHDSLECESCHTRELAGEGWPVLGPGERARSYLGLEQRCDACHADVHGPGMSTQCTECHDQVHFAPASRFDHAGVFLLEGAHAEAACAGCHEDVVPRSAERETPFLPFDRSRGTECSQCHENPHTSPNEAMYGTDCTSCHDAVAFDETHYDRAEHASFLLQGEHRTTSCAACHELQDCTIVGASPASCQTCHANAHLVGGRAFHLWQPEDCARCHQDGVWSAPLVGRELHRRADFPLDGGHGNTGCAECHDLPHVQPGVDAASCATCHESPHRARFEDCARCHMHPDRTVERGFATMAVADHARTAFPLIAPHDGLDCDACHQGSGFAARYPGRSAEECQSCHDDPHRGQFAAAHAACTDCHERHAFEPARFGVAEHRSYPLLGSHAAVSCVLCHAVDPDGVRQFVGTPTACAACHENPHGNQFLGDMARAGCSACHSSFDGWRIPEFDHASTLFPLRGAHASARCDSCHLPSSRGGPRAYRGTPSSCLECHEDPHRGQLTGPAGDCDRCHSERAWLPTSFDHDRHSRYRLEGVHRELECRECHAVQTLPGGIAVVQYRPLGRECRDCHDDR